MTPQSWRRLLLALCALAVLQLTYMVFTDFWTYAAVPGLIANGLPGQSAGEESTASPMIHRLRFQRSNPLASVGIQSGDRIDLRKLSPPERYRFLARWWWLGEHAKLPVVRKAGVQMIALDPVHYVFPLEWWFATAGQYWVLLFAGIVSWRRPDVASVRVLALCLLSWEIGLVFQSQNWITPFPLLDAIFNAANGVLYFGGVALLAAYTTLFSGAALAKRRVAVCSTYVACGAAALQTLAINLGGWTGLWDILGGWLSGTVLADSILALPGLLSLASVLLAVATCSPAERARIMWASMPIGLLFATEAITNLAFSPNVPYIIAGAAERIVNYMIFLAPLGLVYTVLNRRLLDIGFAINRAVVYSGVSLLVVGTFVLFEWALEEWFGTASHAANLAISAGFALLLGLSVRAIHLRVDKTLDAMFFRKRHQDEKAIREFARDAGYITDATALLERGGEVLRLHADAATVEFALDNGAGHYGAVDENDAAVIALRSRHHIVDLHDVRTGLKGEFAFPMVARGRLVGALVLGPKCSGESYAPDEADAILQLAHAVGSTLDVLTSNDGKALGELQSSLQELTTIVRSGFQMLAARLPANESSSAGLFDGRDSLP